MRRLRLWIPISQRCAKKLVEEVDPEHVRRFKQQSGNQRKSLELNTEFLGQLELCKLHGLLIAHLRKSDQPAHTMALFTRIWAEQADFMLQHLDPRWLVSAITTFGDHGQTEVQRRVGHSMRPIGKRKVGGHTNTKLAKQ